MLVLLLSLHKEKCVVHYMVYFIYTNCQDFMPIIPLDMMQPGTDLLINLIILIPFFMGPNISSTYTLEET